MYDAWRIEPVILLSLRANETCANTYTLILIHAG